MVNGKFGKGLAALLGGALFPLGFAPFGIFPAPVLALALLALLLYRASPRAALAYAGLFGLGQFGVGISWIYISIYLYGNASLLLSVAVMLLFVAFLSTYFALVAALLARAAIRSSGWFFLAAFPAAWLLTEWIRSWLFTGFPWLNLAYSQVESPLLGFAPLFGAYGVGWFAAFSAGLLAWLRHSGRAVRLPAVSGLVLIWTTGYGLQHLQWTESAGEPFIATLVQGNISQDLKWRPEQQQASS